MAKYSMNVFFNMRTLSYNVVQCIEFSEILSQVVLCGKGVEALEIVHGKKHLTLRENDNYFIIPDSFINEISEGKRSITFTYNSTVQMSQYNGDDYYEMIEWYPTIKALDLFCHDYFVDIRGNDEYNILGSGRFYDNRCFAENIRSFGIILSKKLEYINCLHDNVLLNCLIPNDNKGLAERLIRKAKDTMTFYKKSFGFYPHSSFTMIPGAEFYRGGFPIATAIVYIHGMYTESSFPYDDWIVSHEMGHQYWGEYVLGGHDTEWLMYGLGLIIDSLYYEDKDRGQYDKYLVMLENAIKNGFPTSLIMADSEELKRLIEDGYDYNTIVKHGRAFLIISKLKEKIGDEKFLKLIVKLLKLHKGKVLTVEKLLAAISESNGSVTSDYIKKLIYE